MRRKIIITLLVFVFSISLLAFLFLFWLLNPKVNTKKLPPGLVSLESVQGEILLNEAEANFDYWELTKNFEPQIYRSYCGVASGVSILNALGINTNQNSFFDVTTNPIAYQLKVLFGGMTLQDLGQYLKLYNVQVSVHHANSFQIQDFRQVILSNLDSPNDYIIINYQREALGQESVGHISPIVAYDIESDMVLILDTASYTYPPTWVFLTDLYAGMKKIDSASERERGFIEVKKFEG